MSASLFFSDEAFSAKIFIILLYFPWVFLFVTCNMFLRFMEQLKYFVSKIIIPSYHNIFSNLYVVSANPLANSEKEISPIMMSVTYGEF